MQKDFSLNNLLDMDLIIRRIGDFALENLEIVRPIMKAEMIK